MRYTKEEFVRRATARHGNKYNYDKVVYVGSQVKVEIVCPEHGSFWQEPASHLRGRGCQMCNPHHKIDTSEFIRRGNAKHNNKYDYSLSDYKDPFTKVKITCPKHGVFEQTPAAHLHGQGCPACKAEAASLRLKKTDEHFLIEMKEMFGDEYDFSKVVYKGTHEKVTVICKKHGAFKRTPHELLDGKACPVCTPNTAWNTETFVKKATEVHNGKYSYEKTVYTDIHTKVCITCPEHGDFWQEPNNHINAMNGCPMCARHRGEECVANFLTKHNIKFIEQYKIKNDNLFSTNNIYVVDFYLPKHNTIIEYNGEQHYEAVDWFGGKEQLEKQQFRDEGLRFYCEHHKIKLIEIPYWDFKNIESILTKVLILNKRFMKTFSVSVDITMSKTIEVLAENEEHAKEIVDSMINENPYGYTNGFSHFVSYEIIDADEED